MKKDFLPAEFKTLLPTIGILLVLVIVSVTLIRIGLSQVGVQTNKLKTLKQEESILLEKQSMLSEVQGNILAQADMAVQILPETNPTLAIISQIKSLAFERSLSITRLSAGSETEVEGGLTKVDINLDVDGIPTSIIDFIATLRRIAPLVNVSKISLTNSGGGTETSMTVVGYWSQLPKEIASISTPLNDLTQEEQGLLSEFSSRLFPSFVVTAPTVPVVRDDPFN